MSEHFLSQDFLARKISQLNKIKINFSHLFWILEKYLAKERGVAILASQHTNTTTTHTFTCYDDILAFEHASIAFEFNRKRITINRCVVQLNKQSFKYHLLF